MTTFEERLARLEQKQSPRVAAPQAEQVADTPSAGLGLSAVLTIPLAIFLGALSVLIGGVIEVNYVQGGMTPSTPIPPAFSFTAFVPALLVSFLADRMVGNNTTGVLMVTAGFIGMIYGEWRLAEMFPTIWSAIYALDIAALTGELSTTAPAPAPTISKTG